MKIMRYVKIAFCLLVGMQFGVAATESFVSNGWSYRVWSYAAQSLAMICIARTVQVSRREDE